MITNAIRVHKQGGPEEMKWEQVELPNVKEGEVLIKHTAIGLNYIDTYHRSGLYPMPVPLTLGIEGAGIVEEVGETCRAILKEDYVEITDGIGDCVVVLTNLAELHGVSIEECIDAAYREIKNRTGKMVNGTYKKD